MNRKDMDEIVAAVVDMIKRDFVLVPKLSKEPIWMNSTRFMEGTLKFVAIEFGITPEEIKAEDSREELVKARQLFLYLCRKYINHKTSNGRMANYVGLRSHASVFAAVNKVEQTMATDSVFNNYINIITNKFKQEINK